MDTFDYAVLTGHARQGAPTIATAPEAAAQNTNADPGREAEGMAAMFSLSSPALWYVALVLLAAAIAKSLGVVRA